MAASRAISDRRGRVWLALVVLGFAGFALLTVGVVATAAVQALDGGLLARSAPLSAYAGVWTFFSELGNYPMIPIGLGYAGWLWWRGRHREAIVALVLFGVATAISEGTKILIARPRPQGGGQGIPGAAYSYPSGHSLEDLMIFGMIALTLWRSRQPSWQKWLFLAFTAFEIVMVSFARVAQAVHYPSDMLAGILVATGILGTYGWLTRPGGWADHPARDWQ
jgi:membrane-associated phospholipid phosphatase